MRIFGNRKVFKLPTVKNPIPDGLVTTPLPVSCLPGGENEAAYQQAFVELTTTDDPERIAAAEQTLTQLGIEPASLTTDI